MHNKHVFANNLCNYMAISGTTRQDLVRILGVSYSSVTDWVHGRKYPRMDKIEVMAKHFGINKSDLIEEKHASGPDEKQDFYLNILYQLHFNPEFYSLMEEIMKVEPAKIPALTQMLKALDVFAK